MGKHLRTNLIAICQTISLVVALSALDACMSALREPETVAANILIPPEEEAKLGQQIEAELATKVRFVSDPRVTSYVGELTERVFSVAKREAPYLAVKVHVIDDPKTVNAFATPGSQLYVYTGLLLAAHDEAEIVGVLGHETGHIVARHPARQMVNQYGLSALASVVLGNNAPLLASLGATIAANGYLLANSRADETEADEYGALFANRANYDPRALGQFLERISGGEPPGVLAFLSDHPTTPDRVAHLEDYIERNGLHGQRGSPAQLAVIKQTLQGGAIGGGPKDVPATP